MNSIREARSERCRAPARAVAIDREDDSRRDSVGGPGGVPQSAAGDLRHPGAGGRGVERGARCRRPRGPRGVVRTGQPRTPPLRRPGRRQAGHRAGSRGDCREGHLRRLRRSHQDRQLRQRPLAVPVPSGVRGRAVAVRSRRRHRRAAQSADRRQRALHAGDAPRLRRRATRVLQSETDGRPAGVRAEVQERRGHPQRPLLADRRGRGAQPPR